MNGIDLSETPQTTCLDIPEDLALYIASYLGGEALARLEATSKACRSLYANEVAWEACVRARWHDPRWLDVPIDYFSAATRDFVQVSLQSARRARRRSKASKPRVTPKQCGANSWSAAYRELHRRNAPPRSWLTPRHAKVVARGRQGACSAWVLLQHTPDCRCVDGTVTLRVVVQNTGAADIVRVEVDDCSLSWLVAEANDNANAILRAAGARELQGREHAVAVPRTGTILECKLVARGHERRSSEGFGYLGFAWLQPLEWVAMEVRVATEDCVHEHDFLERAIQLCVKARLLNRRPPRRDCSTVAHPSTGVYLKLAFIDDATVHRMYSELPGGYVMLSDGV